MPFKRNLQLKAVYRAAYLLTDEYYIGIDQNSDEYLIFFSSKERAADGRIKAVDFEDAGRFQNELLDQSMKLAIGNDTRQIRELIVTRALYSAFIPQEESEEKIDSDEEYNLEEIAEAWKDEE
ncbi:His-Xaa-Ser system protein HxsD [Ruminococcus sp. AM40-10AC]|nr:His-Xaa-Ser system protein HxsD [Ruminococcus sp. AM40-10AC]